MNLGTVIKNEKHFFKLSPLWFLHFMFLHFCFLVLFYCFMHSLLLFIDIEL